MIVHMNYQQYRTARRLVHSCCNYDCGNCLLLDNGEECVCPQSITYSLICKWFRAAVLPLDAGLCAALLHRADRKKCVLCGGYYLPKSNRAKYCPECAVAARRKKEAERQRRRYYDSTHLRLKKPCFCKAFRGRLDRGLIHSLSNTPESPQTARNGGEVTPILLTT